MPRGTWWQMPQVYVHLQRGGCCMQDVCTIIVKTKPVCNNHTNCNGSSYEST